MDRGKVLIEESKICNYGRQSLEHGFATATRGIITILLVVLAFSYSVRIATGQEPPPAPFLEIDGFTDRPVIKGGEQLKVFVTIKNSTHYDAADLQLRLLATGFEPPELSETVPLLFSQQSTQRTYTFTALESTDYNLAAIISYKVVVECRTFTSTQSVSIGMLEAKPEEKRTFLFLPGNLVPQLMTGLFTLTAAIAGMIASYWFNRSARRFEWGKYIWDKYEAEYITFANTLRQSIDPAMLRNRFDSLKGSAFIPSEMHQRFEELLNYLNTEASEANKKARRDNLYKQFEGFIKHPWNYM